MKLEIRYKAPSERAELRTEDLCTIMNHDEPVSTFEAAIKAIQKRGYVLWGDPQYGTLQAIPWHQIILIKQA